MMEPTQQDRTDDVESNIFTEAAAAEENNADPSNDVNVSNYDDEDSEPPARYPEDAPSKADATLGVLPPKNGAPGLQTQDTMMSSPTNSSETVTVRPLTRRQQRMRVVKCYGLVALVVMVCAIGIPLGAVVVFKNKNQEMSFDESLSGGHASDVAGEVVAETVNDTTEMESIDVATVAATPTMTVDEPDVAPVVTLPENPWDIAVMDDSNTTLNIMYDDNTTEPVNFAEPTAEEIATDITVDQDEQQTTNPPTPFLSVAVTENPAALDREDVYFTLVNYTSPVILQDLASVQAHAYKWLVQDDRILPLPTGQKLVQRYSLVALDMSLHEPVRAVLSDANKDECEWQGVLCDESGEVIELRWNRQQLNGELVTEMKLLHKLEFLDLSENSITGTVDAVYEVLSLKQLHLYRNQFSGVLSEQIGLLNNLETINLGHNQLTGRVPLSLRTTKGNPKPLRYIYLHHNQFSGQIPVDWRMRNLFLLDLSHNQLTGQLPADWDLNMISLRHLFLSHNQITGSIPDYFAQLGKGRMKSMFLDNNLLSGGVPTGWGPTDQLTSFAVHNNDLTEPLSPEVCTLSVFETGVMVEMRTDCEICTCETLCHSCV